MTEQMTINSNAKSQLAKLLATENISIRYDVNAKTASFDVKARVLYMPVWKNISEDLHDVLTVHETGHALDTPADGWENDMKAIARKYYNDDSTKYLMAIKSFLNVVEDARIDKRQKRRYPGSRRNYLVGYKELHDKDFFGIKNVNVDALTFIDRANIYFKGGNLLLKIAFTPEERRYLSRMENTETWQQVVDLTDELFGLAKVKQEDWAGQTDIENHELSEDGEEAYGSETGDDDSDDAYGSETSDDDSDDGDDGDSNIRGGESGEAIPESKTDKTYEERKKEIVAGSNHNYNYYKLPKMNHADFVDDYRKFLDDCASVFTDAEWLDLVRQGFNKFKQEENNTISYMVKEFEMRKAADMYSRISITKTGVIDTNKLHSYKYNEDIFRRLATVPKGKNHGFIMFLDWSGSMHHNLKYTLKQLFGLTMFCKRVQIPFEVYLFRDTCYSDQAPSKLDTIKQYQDDYINFGNFRLRNVLSSRMNFKDLSDAYTYLWALTKTHSYKDPMGGTPLNQAIYAAEKLVNDFRARNKLQVVNTIFLTDGESSGVSFGKGGYRYMDINIIQDDVTKKDYRISGDNNNYYGHYQSITTILLQILKSRTNCNLLGFYLYDNKFKYFLARFANDASTEYQNKLQNQWKNDKFVPITNEGYDDYYIIDTPRNSYENETQLKVDSSMSKNKITKTFMSYSQKKTVNRILLNRFMEKVSRNG